MTRLQRIEASFVGTTGALLGAAIVDASRATLFVGGFIALVATIVLTIAEGNES